MLASVTLLSVAAQARPLLCVIDDAQWLDRQSAQALSFMARRLKAERIIFLLAERENGRSVSKVVYLDDLDPESLVGSIHVHGSAYGKLWSLCDRESLRVVGDVRQTAVFSDTTPK